MQPEPALEPADESGETMESLVAAPARVADRATVEAGDWLRMADELFPIAWLTMLVAVCYIGIYFAIETLPGQNLLPGPGWFS